MSKVGGGSGSAQADIREEGVARASGDALQAFATLLAFHRIAVEPAQLRHDLGHQNEIDADDLLRLAKRMDDVRARRVEASWDGLASLPLPALANGPLGWFLIGRVGSDQALIQWPGQAPEAVSRDGMDALWSGELLLVTTREGLAGHLGKFDVTWFIPQIVKYRRLIGEVLLVTLALNLLGLAAPLFFQNVIDKVLVHNTMATLQVLAFGFVAVSTVRMNRSVRSFCCSHCRSSEPVWYRSFCIEIM